MVELFGREGNSGWPLSWPAGVLWALEGLAWERALLAAGKLDPRGARRINPSGQLGKQCFKEPAGDFHALVPADHGAR